MHKIITLAAAASLLTLAACNRDAETAPATGADTIEATAADSAAMDASTSASGGSSGGTGATAAGSGSQTMDPAGTATADPAGAGMGPVTQETRDNAQTAAEETNLHPKPPTN